STYSPDGGYNASPDTFNGARLDAAPLHATRGIYTYGNAFPKDTFNGTNYWVDPVFTLDGQTAPRVKAAARADNVVSWSAGTGVRAAGTLLQGERLSAKWALDTGTFVCSTKAQAEQQLKLSENLTFDSSPAFDLSPRSQPASLPQLPWWWPRVFD